MKRFLAAMSATAFLAGCSSAPQARPGVTAPPAREPLEEDAPGAQDAGAGTREVGPSVAPRQAVDGWWESISVTGPGSASVRSVQLIFGQGGLFSGVILIDADGGRRFSSLAGTWRLDGKLLVVTFSDGRTRSWTVDWDTGTLILKDGEAGMTLRRRSE